MRRLASVVLTGVLLTACGEDAFSPANVSGTYNLETINGSPLPFSMTDVSGITTTTTAGSVSLNANGTYSKSSTFSSTTGSDTTTTTATVTVSGTFELVAPSSIQLTSRFGATIFGTLDGDGLTLIEGGDRFVLRK